MANADMAQGIVMKEHPGATIVRVLDGEDHVSVHFFFKDNDKQYAAINVFRFENREAVDRLENIQEMPSTPNPSGHTMVDGQTEVTDKASAEKNKDIVVGLMNAIMAGQTDKMPTFFEGDNYINHNPEAYDGVSGFAKGMKERLAKGIVTKYDNVILAFGAGNFVQMVTEGSLSGVPTMFFDIFRLKNGKIAEHWDVVAPK